MHYLHGLLVILSTKINIFNISEKVDTG